ncbi:hypothetical protein [Microbulbifer epialgicus]|uniref:Uncharacterized protein n=1 Tax=Microbulbifer epialgicus TaxID=393907 RepID=A0ABV4NU55_9GAMM
MVQELITGTTLPSIFRQVSLVPCNNTVSYRLLIGNVCLEVRNLDLASYATFSIPEKEHEYRISMFDITSPYNENKLSTLRILIMAAYCIYCKLNVDSDLEFQIVDDECLELEHFTRDIASSIPDSILEEELVIDDEEGKASGIYYFVLAEEVEKNNTSYCFIELGLDMPGYCDDNYDAAVSLFVLPNLDENSKRKLIGQRRKSYVDRYLFNIDYLFTNFKTETFSLFGDQFSKACMQSVSEFLAESAQEWCYLATKNALRSLCPSLVEIQIETDSSYDDGGNYFTYLSVVTFISRINEYPYHYSSEGFLADSDLLNDKGEFGGEEFENLSEILGTDFVTNQVFKLVESLTRLMMYNGIHSELFNIGINEDIE